MPRRRGTRAQRMIQRLRWRALRTYDLRDAQLLRAAAAMIEELDNAQT